MKKYLVLLAALVFMDPATAAAQFIVVDPPTQPTVDLSALPLLSVSDVVGSDKFECGFLMPDTASNGLYTQFGPRAIAFNSNNGKLFVSERNNAEPNYVAEITIPTCSYATSLAGLSRATYSQDFTEITEGRYTQADDGNNPGAGMWALFVPTGGSRIYGTYFKYYDNVGVFQIESTFSHSTTLATSSVQGLVQVGSGDVNTSNAGYTSGYIMEIPTGLRSYFGNKSVMMGQCCPSVVTRSSLGHSLGVVDFTSLDAGSSSALTWTPVINYPNNHPTLGCWDTATVPCDNRGVVSGFPGISLYNYATDPTGCVMLPNTRTTACFSVMGANDNAWVGYGEGTANPALHGTPVGDGDLYVYDPANTQKGEHNWPYRNVVLLYNTQHLAEAYAGSRNYYDVVPYAIGDFAFPIATGTSHFNQMLAITYDSANNRIYLTENGIDGVGCCISMGAVWRIVPDLTP